MIGVIDYKAGNAPSVVNALRRLNIACQLVSTPEQLRNFSGVILPGVGSAPATVESWLNWALFLNWRLWYLRRNCLFWAFV